MGYRATGRLAGLIYLVIVVTGTLILGIMPARIFAGVDVAEAVERIRSNETFFRAAVAGGFVCYAVFPALAAALFVLFERAGLGWSILMAAFVATSAAIALAAMSHYLDVIHAVFEVESTNAVAAVAGARAAYLRTIEVATIFWGLWLAPFGVLVFKTRAIPRALGALLLIGCVGYLVNFFAPILAPGYEETPLAEYISIPGSMGEIGSCLWLLIFGAREPNRD